VAALLVLALSGCGGLSQEERRTGVDLGWRLTVDAADQAVGLLPTVYPEIAFVPVSGVFPRDDWSDCSSSSAGSATNPTAIQWTSQRDVGVEPARETATLADGLAAALVAQGWEAEEPEVDDQRHRVRLHDDDISLWLLADTTVLADGTGSIRVLAYSPCLQAPEGMGSWTAPTDALTDAPTG
jgi:hypothetical protein